MFQKKQTAFADNPRASTLATLARAFPKFNYLFNSIDEPYHPNCINNKIVEELNKVRVPMLRGLGESRSVLFNRPKHIVRVISGFSGLPKPSR